MPRPVKAARIRRPGDELTKPQISYLIHGDFHLGEEPFESRLDARRAWIDNRDVILAMRDIPRDFYRNTFPSGTRPWGWWTFEHAEIDCRFQFAALEKMGLIDDVEREAAGRLALDDWERYCRHFTDEWQAMASKVTVDQLLAFWPQLVEVSRDGTVFAFEDDTTSMEKETT